MAVKTDTKRLVRYTTLSSHKPLHDEGDQVLVSWWSARNQKTGIESHAGPQQNLQFRVCISIGERIDYNTLTYPPLKYI